jgi:tetratricopeptide (TPR) repeat protein
MPIRSLSRIAKPAILAIVLLALFAGAARAQLGKRVMTTAGTPEDKAVSEIYAAPDPAAKIALLDKFMTDLGKGEFELLGDQIYVATYLDQKNYPKVYEYGEKVMKLDPNDFGTLAKMVQAADEAGDTPKIFDFGERAGKILTQYKAADAADENAKTAKAQVLEENASDIGRVEYSMYSAASKSTAPVEKAGLMERYAAAFPDSPYTKDARDTAAVAYLQAQKNDKMIEAAQKNLAADPDDVRMLLLLADYWSEKGTPAQLDKALAYAQKALDDLAAAKKPEGVSDDDWKNQVALQQGVAYAAIGMVYVNKGRNPQAIDAFKKASPLLKADTVSYGRNLYRWGFTLAKMRRLPEAKVVLNQAMAVDSPYKPLAKQTLDTISTRAN